MYRYYTMTYYSNLWGANGELWRKDRLSDFSYAGYEYGETGNKITFPITTYLNIKTDFGAKGDGQTDDSAAFIQALAKIQPYTELFIPAGKYILSSAPTTDPTNPSFLTLSTPYVSIRGEDQNTTILYFSKSWRQITGKFARSMWSFGPLLFTVKGQVPVTGYGTVLNELHRGDTSVTISDVTPYSVGDYVRLTAYDTNFPNQDHGQFTVDLSGPVNVPLAATQNGVTLAIDQQVTSIDRPDPKLKSGTLHFKCPLPFDMLFIYKVGSRRIVPSVHHVAITNMTFDCDSSVTYTNHFYENGYNLLGLDTVYHCLLQNLNVYNGEYGIQLARTSFTTVDNVVINGTRQTICGGRGHHGYALVFNCHYNLLQKCYIGWHQFHDFSLGSCDTDNVLTYCGGYNANIDRHGGSPINNLIENFDFGKGTNVWSCGGDTDAGLHAAQLFTYWNCYASTNPKKVFTLGIAKPSGSGMPHGFSLKTNFCLGGSTAESPVQTTDNLWIENTPVQTFFTPRSLYQTQLNNRLHPAPVQVKKELESADEVQDQTADTCKSDLEKTSCWIFE